MNGTSAAWWTPMDNGQVACNLCPVGCRLREGQTGPCATRANHEGTMMPLHYGRVVASAVDPIEKKPLYHFHPGRKILSVAAPGCNLHCLFCQNWSISQDVDARTTRVTADELIATARAENSVGVAFTYSEPLVWFEFVLDTARAFRAAGLKTVLVTNGYLNPEPLAELIPWIDAANVDLKSMDDVFYRKVCRARLAPVLEAIEAFRTAGVHLEITNLVIPGHNDDEAQIIELVEFVAGLGRDIPLHFSAYHPAWKMTAPPTKPDTLRRAREIALRKLDHVYLGNVAVTEGRDTGCPDCGTVAVGRAAGTVDVRLGKDGDCTGCGRRLPLVVA